MAYENENVDELKAEVTEVLSEALVAALRNKEVARERAIRLYGIRKASDDYDYERAGDLVFLLQRGFKKVQEELSVASAGEFVKGVLEALRDPMEGFSYPFAVLEEIRFAYTKGAPDLRQKLYARYHETAELIRNPPKKPLPEAFLERFDEQFEAFLQKKAEKEVDWQNAERREEARTLAARVKAVAQSLGNSTDLHHWIERERTAAGGRCSSLIRDRDSEGRFDPDLEAEYEQASRRTGTVALLASFLYENGIK